jgi:hypothetical protein
VQRKICEGGSKDLVRNIESEGSIFSIRKKTDGGERSFSMLVDKDGDPRPMLVDKDGDSRPMLVDIVRQSLCRKELFSSL